MSVYDDRRFPHLLTEMKLIEDAPPTKSPVLGICFGAQLIVETLGADVYPSNQKEIRWCDLHITPEDAHQSIVKSLGAAEIVSSGMEILLLFRRNSSRHVSSLRQPSV
jgi:GMP synthase-like glutamine amidotransferase